MGFSDDPMEYRYESRREVFDWQRYAVQMMEDDLFTVRLSELELTSYRQAVSYTHLTLPTNREV